MTDNPPPVSRPTRERLLDAALRSFAVLGVEGTVITDLEEAAGLAPGSGGFYRYFRTKDEVLDAVVRREIERITARGAGAPSPPAPGGATSAATLRDELVAVLDGLGEIGPLIAILAREHGRIPGLAAEISRELIDTDIAARKRQGLDRAAGAVVLSALVGYHLSTDYFGGAPGGVGRDEFVDALVELLAPGSSGGRR